MGYFDNDRRDLMHQWLKARVAHIHDEVTAGDVLVRHGISLRYGGQREEQISCPFHGEDKNPSARYFPEDPQSKSHVWCFACHKRWDAISLWRQYNGEAKFSETLFNIERAFGLTPPKASIPQLADEYDPLVEEIEDLFDACEHRLREERDHFEMGSHLRIGSLLDQIRSMRDRGSLTLDETKKLVTQVVSKIGEKVRASAAVDTKR